jgi:hypothetical protein
VTKSEGPEARQLAVQISSKDPDVGLRAVAALRRLLAHVERLQVDNARDLGWSWEEVANALGVSKQSVHEKHGPRRNSSGKEE